MRIAKRMAALSLSLLVLMMTTAVAEIPFLMHSADWTWDVPVEVMIKADVDTHMPFDDERLAMLTPVTDLLALRLTTGDDEGLVAIDVDGNEVLSLQYRGHEAQLSSFPDVTFQAEENPLDSLLGIETSSGNVYEMLKLAPEGESLLTDGLVLLDAIPSAFDDYGARSANTTNISGYGPAAYRVDYTVPAGKAGSIRDTLLEICPEGWLKEIISNLTFSGKQTLRIYYTAEDVMLRAEYNGSCGPENDLRTVKLVCKARHDDTTDKDYLELTSPAQKGKNKNTLTFERTVETNKKGQRILVGEFSYTMTENNVTSIWKGSANLVNAYSDIADVISGEVMLEYKLNGAEKYDTLILKPGLSVSGTADSPMLSGTLDITEKYANKATEHAVLTVELKKAEPLMWEESFYTLELALLGEEELAAVRQEAAASITTALVRPLILKMGMDADWFFREMPESAVQAIIDAAGAAD